MTFEEWRSLSDEEKKDAMKMAEKIDKQNKSLLRSYRYYTNKKEKRKKKDKNSYKGQ